MKKQIFTLALLFTIILPGFSQVGLNNPNPDPSAILDLKSTDKGILIPRMTTGERNAMAIATPAPAKGLLVFDLTLNRFYFWNGSQWKGVNVVLADSTGANEVIRIERRATIGNGYLTAQPQTNGLLVEGNTAIGTTNPAGNKLRVQGSTELDGNTSVTGTLNVTGTTTLGTTNAGTTTITGNATVTGTVIANDYAPTGSNKNGPVPQGGIIMWSGSTSNIPTGWALCNGANGTPDLRDRFIVGAGSTYSVNNTGGSAAHNHNCQSAGNHSHGLAGSTTGGNTGGITDYDPTKGSFDNRYFAKDDQQGWTRDAYLETHTSNTQREGDHAHTLHGDTQDAGSHSHTIDNASNIPPYYALAFIMKL